MRVVVINELLKLIPADKAYEDVAQPALRELGKSLEKVIKASRFIIAPLEYLAAQHERWERYLRKVAENVDEDNLIEGHPQIIVPTLEGLCYVQEDTIISEMFVNLLSNAIDKTKQDSAHPAFPKIISQLSPDEAVVLFFLKMGKYKVTQQADYDIKTDEFASTRTIYEEFPLDKLVYPQHIGVYMDHLSSLNLAGTWQIKQQEIIKDKKTKIQTGVYIYAEHRLTEFGRLFAEACVPKEYKGLA